MRYAVNEVIRGDHFGCRFSCGHLTIVKMSNSAEDTLRGMGHCASESIVDMGAKWKYSFWRRRHERGPDIIKIHSEGRAGWIAYRRQDDLYLLDYEMSGKSWCNVWSHGVRQLTPTARRLPVEEGLAIIEELRGALPSIEVQ